MQIKELFLYDYKGFRMLDILELSEDRAVVIAGANGAGKSTILEGIAILLSAFVARMKSQTAIGRKVSDRDIRIGNQTISGASIGISIEVKGKIYDWKTGRAKVGVVHKSELSDYRELKDLVDTLHRALALDRNANMPVVSYYPTNRSVLDIPLRVRGGHTFSQLDAYDMALDGGGIAFRRFFEWFREQEDIENETIRRDDSSYRDPQLEAIRSAIENIRPEYSDLSVRRNPLRMVVNKAGQELAIDRLSDGEKCLIALVGDLARRFAIANPGLADRLEGTGIVLIDEIELHLHPQWQREIIPSLLRTFPNCQFIVTTHSPQILSEVNSPNLFYLENFELTKPEPVFGKDSNYILQTLMDVDERPVSIKSQLAKLFDHLDRGELTEANELRLQLESTIGPDDPMLVRADVILRRRELARK